VSVDPATFERMYRAEEDPWSFATSAYEAAKYERTVAALGARRFRRGLELGCSIGVLTARLAERCEELVAIDTSATAVARARARVGTAADVRIATLPDDLPEGPFDLVVASEVLYYFEPGVLAGLLDAIEAALEPGGLLLAVHWRPPTRTYPLRGDEVHDILAGRAALEPLHAERTERYRLDLLRAAG
jgi:cyclopropane fatty-acyl-phospholipid synthase-like methyltransferase